MNPEPQILRLSRNPFDVGAAPVEGLSNATLPALYRTLEELQKDLEAQNNTRALINTICDAASIAFNLASALFTATRYQRIQPRVDPRIEETLIRIQHLEERMRQILAEIRYREFRDRSLAS